MDSPAPSSCSSGGDTPNEIPLTQLSNKPEVPNKMSSSSTVLTNGYSNSFPSRKETTEDFFRRTFTSFSTFNDIDALSKNISRLADLITSYRSAFAPNFCKFADLLKYFLGWTNYCLTDPDVSKSLDDALSNLFEKFIQVYLSLTSLFFSFFIDIFSLLVVIISC